MSSAQQSVLKVIEDRVKQYILPEVFDVIPLTPFSGRTSPEEISQVYTKVLNQMQELSRAIAGLRDICANIRWKLLKSAMDCGTDSQREFLSMKTGLERIASAAEGFIDAYKVQLDALSAVSKGLSHQCYMFGAFIQVK